MSSFLSLICGVKLSRGRLASQHSLSLFAPPQSFNSLLLLSACRTLLLFSFSSHSVSHCLSVLSLSLSGHSFPLHWYFSLSLTLWSLPLSFVFLPVFLCSPFRLWWRKLGQSGPNEPPQAPKPPALISLSDSGRVLKEPMSDEKIRNSSLLPLRPSIASTSPKFQINQTSECACRRRSMSVGNFCTEQVFPHCIIQLHMPRSENELQSTSMHRTCTSFSYFLHLDVCFFDA